MNARTFSACLSVVICVGCATPHRTTKGITPFMVAFSEAEIRSRTWNDSSGHRLGLLDWSEIALEGRTTVLIAKYGSPDTRYVTCLDFYQTIETVAPPGRMFSLIAHDCAPTVVTKVEFSGKGKETSIHIVRESAPDKDTPRTRFSYWRYYPEDYVIQEGLMNNISSVLTESDTHANGTQR